MLYDLKFAEGIAETFIDEISPYCEKRFLVGSIRRRVLQVHDIDIVLIPKYEQTKDDTLFGEPVSINLLDRKLAQLCMENRLTLDVNGSLIKRFLNFDETDIPIDLYIATEATWHTLVLIRTGSKQHNIKLCMRAQDLRMQLKADGQGLVDAQLKIIPINSEEDIFQRLQFPFVIPENRK